MKAKLTEVKSKSLLGRASRLFKSAVCLGAVILICSSASAQNVLVSGKNTRGGQIYKFTWDGVQSIFASGLVDPLDVTCDGADNLFVVDYNPLELIGNALIYKIAPNGVRTILASGLSYHSYLAADSAGSVFAADYDNGIIYKYKPDGARATFASGLNHPIALAFDAGGNLFAVDNSAGNIYQGSIYKYKSDGSRVTIAGLEPTDRPADLAFDSLGNLFLADLGGNIYEYNLSGVLRRQGRTKFGSVPNSAESLAFDSAGNLFVVDSGDVNGKGNAIYKFTQQGVRSALASGQALGETFSHVALKPMLCCQ